MTILDYPSPNFDERRDGEKPSLIVLHYTACQSAEHALHVLSDPHNKPGRVSAHYMIHEDGTIYKMVDENKRAWHAGIGGWQGRVDDLNSASIGIEISNRSPVVGQTPEGKDIYGAPNPYTKEQLVSLVALCHQIMHRHKIPAYNIIGHSDMAPNRKQDPGYHFPWRDLSKHGIGIRPKPTCVDKFNASAVAKDPVQLRDLFTQAGYPTTDFSPTHKAPSTESLIKAFQQRYEPEAYVQAGGKPGVATEKTVTLLRAVARDNAKKRAQNLVYKK